MSRSDWPLDRALERLRVYRLPYRWDEQHLSTWAAVCPACMVGAWTLTIREHGRGGPIDLRCSAGCDSADVAAVLERDPAEDRIEEAEQRAREAIEIAAASRDVAARAIAFVVAILDEDPELARAA